MKAKTAPGLPPRVAGLAVFVLAALLPVLALSGQILPPPSAPAPAAGPTPTPAQVQGPSPVATGGGEASAQAVRLNPFIVPADRDSSYEALNANSVTGFNVPLADLPLSADIFTDQFMKDLGVNSVEQVLKLSAGSGYAGADPANTANYQPGDVDSNSWITIRGLDTPVMTRDDFMPIGAYGNTGSTGEGFTSNFDLERVEVIHGPQGLLYGGGGAGGVIDVVSKQARIGTPAFGSLAFASDQYGTRNATLDCGFSTKELAVRFAFLDGDNRFDRVGIGGPIQGSYGQFAFLAGRNTTIRITGERTEYRRTSNDTVGIDMDNQSGAAFDRNGYNLHTLIASNAAGASDPVSGAAYPSGAIDNGFLNLSNADSYSGWWVGDDTKDEFADITADTRWLPWFSTRFGAGYNDYDDLRPYGTATLYSPLSTSNPIPGVWSESLTPLVYHSPIRTKAVRAQGLVENTLFGGRARSKTLFGSDYIRTDAAQDTEEWFQADSHFNAITGAGGSVDGRTPMPAQAFSVADGPIFDPLFSPYQTTVTLGGQNYTEGIINEVNPSLISPEDPLGVTYGGSTYQQTKLINQGDYLVNDTDWWGGRLDSIVGARIAKSYEEQLYAGNALSTYNPDPHDVELSVLEVTDFNVGLVVRLAGWVSVYGEYSNNYQPPPVSANDPDGNQPRTSHGVGGEAGFKFANADQSLSATLSFFADDSRNEEYLMNGTLLNDISPKGVSTSSTHANGGNQWVPLNKTSRGVELALTSAPTPAWRVRLSGAITDGTIHSMVQYQQLYDDDFHTNSAGQVTFQDGAVAWVPNTPSSKTPVVAPGTARAAPLTLSEICDPSSPYYAFTAGTVPVAVQVTNSSLLNVIKYSDAADGAIATGLGGLPWQQAQILPAFANGGFTVPGTIVVFEPGDKTCGYPEFSLNLTNLYSFSRGWMNGFSVGGAAVFQCREPGYYYFPDGVTPTAPRALFWMPNSTTFELILGYTRRFARVTWSVQLNVDNVFNHYGQLFLPAENSGWAAPSAVGAALFNQPRMSQVSSSLSF